MFDRYASFRIGGEIRSVPYISLQDKSSDIFITYEKGKHRLDLLSYKYYGDSNYAWLILQANPQYGSMEFLIPDKSKLKIPYPLNETLEEYNKGIELFFRNNRF